jgi:hypothetical protein
MPGRPMKLWGQQTGLSSLPILNATRSSGRAALGLVVAQRLTGETGAQRFPATKRDGAKLDDMRLRLARLWPSRCAAPSMARLWADSGKVLAQNALAGRAWDGVQTPSSSDRQ